MNKQKTMMLPNTSNAHLYMFHSKNIVDKYWNAEFSVTFHNSDVIPLKVTGIRCQAYINGVGLTMFHSWYR